MQVLLKDVKLDSRFVVETRPTDFVGCTPKEKVVGPEMPMLVVSIVRLGDVTTELLSKLLGAVGVLVVDPFDAIDENEEANLGEENKAIFD